MIFRNFKMCLVDAFVYGSTGQPAILNFVHLAHYIYFAIYMSIF